MTGASVGMGSTRVIATCLLLLACVCLSPAQLESGSLQAQERPNILFILTDDQDVGSMSELPNIRSQLVERGTTFDRAYATTPLCCPSRTSILRGQYAHNHKVWDNKAPDGGFERFQRLDLEASTVARWLDEAGYHTGYIGKYLNEYGSYEEPTTHVPPGWDRWIGYEGGPLEQHAREAFKVNDQGNVARIEAVPGYDTDLLRPQGRGLRREPQGGQTMVSRGRDQCRAHACRRHRAQ